MVKLKFYKLRFTAPLHIGDTSDDCSISLRTIQSDTIYAALIACMAKLGNSIPDTGDLGFSISSLFPFYQKDNTSPSVFFFPKPMKQSLPQIERVEDIKTIKKVVWFDLNYFQKNICGETLFDKSENINNIQGNYLTNEEINENFLYSQVSSRVKVSRTGNEEAQPFYMDRVFFRDHSGLFFIAIGDTTNLEIAMQLLQYEGIGTDRNVGNGFFTYSVEEKEIQYPSDDVTCMISLSMFIPESAEQLSTIFSNDSVLAYDFVRRGGWMTTPPYNSIRKNTIYAFLPGSVFYGEIKEITIKGRLANLKPSGCEHNVWRNGKSVFIPAKL